jgi:hypothetical protein
MTTNRDYSLRRSVGDVAVDLLTRGCARALTLASQSSADLLTGRIALSGRGVRFEPSAMLQHRRDGSSTSPVLFRVLVALAAVLGPNDGVYRRGLAFNLNRERWQEIPRATKPPPVQQVSGRLQRGAVIVPAYNEATVIERTLGPLSQAAVDGFFELIVVCNGCTDNTAEVARSVPGVRVVELELGSKPAALNAGDEAATLWPRLYVDADIQISAAAILAVLDRLTFGDVLAARPESRYDFDGASALVRCYYRARQRIPQHKLAMWGAGVYGLSAKGHQRLGVFPMITGDDLYVDTRFDADEKAVVATDPAIVKTPADSKSLLAILRRSHRGNTEMSTDRPRPEARTPNTSLDSAVAAVRAIRGPRSAVDSSVYIGMALAKRWSIRQTQVWERDESSRSSSDSHTRPDGNG